MSKRTKKRTVDNEKTPNYLIVKGFNKSSVVPPGHAPMTTKTHLSITRVAYIGLVRGLFQTLRNNRYLINIKNNVQNNVQLYYICCMKVNFWYGSKANPKNPKPNDKINIRVNGINNSSFRQSLKLDISLDEWDLKNKSIVDFSKDKKNRTDEEYTYLKELKRELNHIREVFNDEKRKLKGAQPNNFTQWCKNTLAIARGEQKEVKKEQYLYEFMETTYKHKLIEDEISPKTVKAWIPITQVIKKFGEYQMKADRIEHHYKPTELNKDFYRQLKLFMKNEIGIKGEDNPNYFATVIKKVKATISHFEVEDDNFKYHKNVKGFKSTNVRVPHGVLSDDEMDKIYNYEGKAYLNKARDIAILLYHGCFRFIELDEQLRILADEGYSALEIIKEDDRYYWDIQQAKKCSPKNFPLSERLTRMYIDEKFPHYISGDKSRVNLRKLLEELNITIPVKFGTHTFRRSFCTSQWNKGASARDIMSFSGHETEAMLKEYVQKQNRNTDNKISLN